MSRIEYISLAGLRVDGRRPEEARRISCKLGMLPNVDGSGYMEQGNTKVVAAVLGPREVVHRSKAQYDKAIISCDYTIAPFATTERKQRGPGDRKLTESAQAIQKVFESVVQVERYPKSEINIQIQILQADGGALPTAINAVTLALLDAGIAMSEFVVGCSAGYLEKTPVLDLNYIESSGDGPEIPIAYLPTTGKISMLQLNYRIPIHICDTVMELAEEGCKQIYDLMQSEVREYTLRRLNSRGMIDAS